MSENSFFIPGLPKDMNGTAAPSNAAKPKPANRAGSATGDSAPPHNEQGGRSTDPTRSHNEQGGRSTDPALPHNEQGGRSTDAAPPHNEQGGRSAAREPDRYEPTVACAMPGKPAAASAVASGAKNVKAPHPMRVHPLTSLCVAALLTALLVHAMVSSSPGAMTIAFGLFAAIVVGGLVVAMIPFLLFRKSNRVLNFAMCLQMCAGIAGAGLLTWRETEKTEDQKVIGQADASILSLNGKMRNQLKLGEAAVIDAADIDRAADVLAGAADKLEGGDAAVLRAAASLMSSFADRNQAFDSLSAELEEMGGLDPSTMKSRDDIEKRLTLINQFLTLNHEFEGELKSAPRRFRDSLVKEGLGHKELARAENDFAASFKLPMQLQFRRLQAQFGESAKEYLGLLSSQWGHWTFSTDNGQVVFQNQTVIERFNQASDALQGSMLAMASIQREVLNVDLVADLSDEAE